MLILIADCRHILINISASFILLITVCEVTHAQQGAVDNPAEALELQRIEIIGTTPLPGLGTPLSKVPANAQVFSAKDIAKQKANNLVDFLESNPNGVSVNSAQGNPYQTDINFRGFTASPLLGTPQGLSVFLDGVRVNEPFGDVVNWDLIPQFALSGIQVIPGSNPTFGLNTLGGAVGLYTKSGSSFPGTTLELSTGSFGRKTFELQTGGKFSDEVDYYFGANISRDNGWAKENRSSVKQVFTKIGWQNDITDIDTTLLWIDNTLRGTQTLPVSFFDKYFDPYTYPDINHNQLSQLSVKLNHVLNKTVLMGGDVYYRRYRSSNFASNINDQFDINAPQFQAINDLATIAQDSYGAGVQLTLDNKLGEMKSQTVLGASVDANRVRYIQQQQEATFTASRESVGINDFVQTVDAKTSGQNLGIYINNLTELSPQWSMTLSGRYNRSTVQIRDQTGSAPDLNGDHVFTRFNPAIGFNYNPHPNYTAYMTVNQGMRSPTAIELTCADPQSPCRLPNSFLADPPLKPVISRTVEIGARGKFGEVNKNKQQSNWSAALFRTELTDDIQFISSGSGLNAGYFANVGNTERRGLELALQYIVGPLKMTARYSRVQATFRTGYVSHSPGNDTADANGDIIVSPGNVIPSIAPQTFKLRLDYSPMDALSVGMSANYSAAVYPRGNENNLDSRGKVPGFTVFNLDARYNLTPQLQLFARVNNLFDKRYSNFGVLGDNFFNNPSRTFSPAQGIDPTTEQFRGLGAPRGIWVGLNYALDDAAAKRRDD